MPPSMASTASQLRYLCLVCTTCCVTKATPNQFIDVNKLKSCRMSLTNHKRSISHNIMSLVINGLGADTQTYRRANKNDFKKPGVHSLRAWFNNIQKFWLVLLFCMLKVHDSIPALANNFLAEDKVFTNSKS